MEESIGSRLMLQEQMVSTGEDDETGAGDASGQLAPGLEWSHELVTHMHNKRRCFHFGKNIRDIEIAANIEVSSGAVWRRSFSVAAR